jgi:glutamine amidotransferase
MKTVIVKYNAGNVESVKNALKRLGVEALVTNEAAELESADKVIFPGVGEASSAMLYLRERKLDKTIKNLTCPVLGICLGMQLLSEFSEENKTKCLNLIPVRARKFTSETEKVPHVGWNQIYNLRGKLFAGVAENSFVYFVHSYFVEMSETAVAVANYIEDFSAAVSFRNFYGIQFHAEKSGATGERILENFLKL